MSFSRATHGGRPIPLQILITLIAMIVAVTWSAVAFASLWIQDYTALTIISPAMLIVVGALFAAKRNGRNGGSRAT